MLSITESITFVAGAFSKRATPKRHKNFSIYIISNPLKWNVKNRVYKRGLRQCAKLHDFGGAVIVVFPGQ